MVGREEAYAARERAARMLREAGLRVSEEEIQRMDVADFGLSDLEHEGAQIVSLFETTHVAARVIVLFPGQTEPEHRHVSVAGDGGKEETIRVVSGRLFFYLPGEGKLSAGRIPLGKEAFYTARREIVLEPCDVLTVSPGTPHWFQAGSDGAVFYTMSTTANDDSDPFTDPNVVRRTVIR